ncbi:hypothetical protein GYMLUDRAFT_42907 [Collybiopsis luxurians FD-317 M1]|uniref:Uncharacterized protein n=1 Tax=Collybiopsis luxurians FD-317 M1 TaxID=944289 RepID=A0A0D0CFG1_9AGAR|nr:hypothetical protein GYMLUDRAFT_42907 [Collybiopsis luxurians FD-317 M1]
MLLHVFSTFTERENVMLVLNVEDVRQGRPRTGMNYWNLQSFRSYTYSTKSSSTTGVDESLPGPSGVSRVSTSLVVDQVPKRSIPRRGNFECQSLA